MEEGLIQFFNSVKDVDLDTVRAFIQEAPDNYRQWWLHMYRESPYHVIVETVLIVILLYVLIFRKTKEAAGKGGKSTLDLSEKEINELVADWKPEPLGEWDSNTEDESEEEELVLEKKIGNHVFIQGLEKKNAKSGEAKNSAISFGSYDFLGMSAREELREITKMTLDKYGCGSCGPRGFYGSIDSHVLCEQEYAKFMEVDEGIAYSDSASAVSSTLPAFAKRGDLVIADAGCHEPITTAINLSRAICKTFSHNDMDHLERILEDIKKTDIEWGRNTKEQKRFIVVEGLYKNYGDIAPLDKLIELKKKYCFRLVVDESYSFGCFGKGKGITELFKNVSIHDIDLHNISIAHSMGSIGGLCVGRTEVIDHQRLSGAGYCFSASAPPFTTNAAITSLNILRNEPQLVSALNENTKYMIEKLSKECNHLSIRSQDISPIIHLELNEDYDDEEAKTLLASISKECLSRGIYIPNAKYTALTKNVPPPTLRLTVNAIHTKAEIDKAVDTLVEVCNKLLK